MRSTLFDAHLRAGARMIEVDGWEAPDVFTSIEAEYAAAWDAAVVYDSSPLGRLQLTGKTRLDFLDRMSTNDMNGLRAGQGAATILTTPIARIVDRVVVYVREDDAITLTSRGAQAAVANWLRKYIFFNDDVQVRDALEPGMLSVYGAKAADTAASVAGEDVSDLPLHFWRSVRRDLLIARADPVAGDGFHVLAPDADALASAWQTAIDAGAAPIGERAYEVLRIESGRPRFGREIGENYIPLEVGLWPDVSFTKGCYIGQEIIARMESRHRLARQMVGLRGRASIEPGAELYVNGAAVGRVSSAAWRPGGDSIALGFVKPAFAGAGTRISLGANAGAEIWVEPLPLARAVLTA